MRLLSIDFDFFFPVAQSGKACLLFDWGHWEGTPFQSALWPFRAAAFLGVNRPLPQTSEEEDSFWDRVSLTPGAEIFVADSHATALLDDRVLDGITRIVSVDAHHDTGYHDDFKKNASSIDCANWLLHAQLSGCEATVIYPRWQGMEPGTKACMAQTYVDDGRCWAKPFDRVFLCRSSAWVPPWVEPQFWKFVSHAPSMPQIIEEVSPRTWGKAEMDAARTQADAVHAHHEYLVHHEESFKRVS